MPMLSSFAKIGGGYVKQKQQQQQQQQQQNDYGWNNTPTHPLFEFIFSKIEIKKKVIFSKEISCKLYFKLFIFKYLIQ